jgi:hypothetical protein
MSVWLMINLGNSDLLADGARPRAPRPDGKALYETYEQHRFELPIIEPCLREMLTQEQQIDALTLFYTDQPESPLTTAPDRYGVSLRDKDTLWYAQIIRCALSERFPETIGAITLARIERADASSINPSMYDEALDAYGDLLARQYDPTTTACYVLMAGGIPACNTALQLQAISCYGERCRTIYQPERGSPYELRVGAQVLGTFRRATAIDALQRQDFATALPLVRQIAGPHIVGLVAYASYREAFDFERAQAELDKAKIAASGETREFLDRLRRDLDALIGRENIGALLRELSTNAAITYRNGRYADFLGRLFRFQEAALRYIVETKIGLPTDMSKARIAVNGPAFVNGIAANVQLKEALDARTLDGAPLRYDTPNLPTMQAMLDFIVKPSGVRADGAPYLTKAEAGQFGEIQRRLNKISALAQLRNQSVIAHGFTGVSHERLAEVYGNDPEGLLEDLRKIMQLLQLGGAESPFERIAQFAIQQIRRGAR